jgi:hypothetical protein
MRTLFFRGFVQFLRQITTSTPNLISIIKTFEVWRHVEGREVTLLGCIVDEKLNESGKM